MGINLCHQEKMWMCDFRRSKMGGLSMHDRWRLVEIINILAGRSNVIIVVVYFVIGCIPLKVAGQNYKDLEQLVDETEEVKFLSTSDNGKWLVYSSETGDGRKKKMVLQNTVNPNQVIERLGVNQWMFLKNHIAILSGNKMEYLNPETGQSQMYKHVKSIDYDQQHDVFVVFYDESNNRKLELYTSEGNLLQTLDKVSFYSFSKSHLIVRRKIDAVNEVWVMKGKVLNKLFATSDEIKNVMPSGLRQGGFAINTRNERKSSFRYITNDLQESLLEGSEFADYEEMTVIASRDDNKVVLKLTKIIPKENGLVDVWYGTDFDLKKHVRAVRKSMYVEWNPISNEKKKLSRDDYFGETAIGNSLYLRYLVDKDQVDIMDKAAGNGFDQLFLWNSITDVTTFVADVHKQVVISPTGKFLLIQGLESWKLFDTEGLQLQDLKINSSATPYFTSSNHAIWTDGGTIYQMDLLTQRKTNLYVMKDAEIELLNFERISTELQYPRDFRFVDLKKGLLLKIADKKNKMQSYAWLKNRRMTVIIPPTKDYITEFAKMKFRDDFYWIQENFNKLPVVIIKSGNESSKTMYVSNLGIEQFEKAEIKKIYYKGADGEQITGTLYMPLQYDRLKKYPVVVHIYEKQEYLTNHFLRPSFANGTGLNIPLLMEQGFAVLLADISYCDKGPGISALESINNALDELQKIENVDMSKVGLMGQSFGGYETNFIATHSKRFAAYISGASVSDVIRTYYAFNDNFNAPDYYRYEGGQNNYKKTLAENPEKYLKNNPIMYVQNINAPMLLWAGKNDGNVSPEGIKSLYIALRKYRKPVVALFYDKEGHSLSKTDAQKDLSLRILDWWNYYLKGQKNIRWIDKQTKGAE